MATVNHSYSLYVHSDLDDQLEKWSTTDGLVNKVLWAQQQLAIRGRTPRVKATYGQNCLWRRTPVHGNHYYLWWIPAGASCAKGFISEDERAVFIRALRTHDENDKPLDLGDESEYSQIKLDEINPRYPDQDLRKHCSGAADAKVIALKGPPGSGKTVALQFATRDRVVKSLDSAIYVTYTSQLADDAREFFQAQNLGDHIQVYTLDELLDKLSTPKDQIKTSPLKSRASFCEEYQRNPASAEPWRDYLDLLWLEINAFLLGMALPFPWKRQGLENEVTAGEVLDKSAYNHIRKDMINEKARESAYRFVSDLEADSKRKFFPHQLRAKNVLQELQEEIVLRHLKSAGTLLIDEIQDLTLVQIALLARIAGILAQEKKCFRVIIAGDESQTVLPSGFDWACTQDLFHHWLRSSNVEPQEFKSQRRSPPEITKILNKSEELYKRYCDQAHYPEHVRLEQGPGMPDSEDHHQIIRWIWDDQPPWNEVFETTTQHTNLAFVDLSKNGMLDDAIEQIESETLKKDARARIYTRDSIANIKGLERAVVIVTGLDYALEQLEQKRKSKRHELLQSLRNRELIDQIRVALSRSTQTLIIAEAPQSNVAKSLNCEESQTMDWRRLQVFLKDQIQDLDIIEKINDLLNQTREAIGREEYARAEALNRQARELADGLEDQVIKQDLETDGMKITVGLAREATREIQQHLDSGEFPNARLALESRKAHLDKARASDDGIREALSSIERDLELWDLLKASEQQTPENPLNAFETRIKKIQPLLKHSQNSYLRNKEEKLKETLRPSLRTIANDSGRTGGECRIDGKWQEAANAYDLARRAHQELDQNTHAGFYGVLADRYAELPPPVDQANVAHLMTYICNYRHYDDQLLSNGQAKQRGLLLVDWVVELMKALAISPDQFEVVQEDLAATLPKVPNHKDLKQAVEQVVDSLREKGKWRNALALIDMLKDSDSLKDKRETLECICSFMGKWETFSPNERREILKILGHTTDAVLVTTNHADAPL